MSLLDPNVTVHAVPVTALAPGSTTPRLVPAEPTSQPVATSRFVALGTVAVTTVDELAPHAEAAASTSRSATPMPGSARSSARPRGALLEDPLIPSCIDGPEPDLEPSSPGDTPPRIIDAIHMDVRYTRGMAKTTVNLDDDLLRAAKKHAVDEGTTLGRLIERGLRTVVGEAAAPEEQPLELPAFDGGGRTLVDLTSRDSIYDAIDRP